MGLIKALSSAIRGTLARINGWEIIEPNDMGR